jgi:hypothetical protein
MRRVLHFANLKKKNYMIKVGTALPTPISLTTTTTDPAVIAKCGTDLPWLTRPFSTSCYFFSQQSVTAEDAELDCAKFKASPLSITSYTEQAFVASQLAAGKTYWLGARRSYTDGWSWLNGNPFIFTNWASLTGSDSLGQTANTAAVISADLNGLWDAVPMSTANFNKDIKYNIVCEKKQQTRDPSESTVAASTTPANGYRYYCDGGDEWLNRNDNCYKYMDKRSDHKTFDEARQACHQDDSASDLVDVFSESENEFLLTTVMQNLKSLRAEPIKLGCPSGWLMGPDNANCYKFWNFTTYVWDLAQNLCENTLDGYLVSIKSKAEQDFILASFGSSIGEFTFFWL